MHQFDLMTLTSLNIPRNTDFLCTFVYMTYSDFLKLLPVGKNKCTV